jgi:predicted nucleotidyltransferase
MQSSRHNQNVLVSVTVLPVSHESGAKLAELLREIVTTLSQLTCVRSIHSFGSVAIGTSDQWSDLDLLVECADVDKTPWRAAAAIRALKPVLFYRMFSGVPQPSGRYWFCDESPFLRLDVSFHSTAEHRGVVENGV